MGKPKVLLAATCRWLFPARLARALADAGCGIEAICPSGHALAKTAAVIRLHPYSALASSRAFQRAIRKSRPDLIIPCDDLAAEQLRILYTRAEAFGPDADPVRNLLDRSLGPRASYPVIESRSELISVASSEGIRVPETAPVSSLAEIERWLERHGYPAVLKSNGSSGGQGVRVVTDLPGAQRAFSLLSSPPSIARTLKRAFVDRDLTLVDPLLRRRRPSLSIQKFVAGREVTCTVACWNGEIRAMLIAEVLCTWEPRGPASVLRLIQNDAISSAVAKIVRRLGLSNLCGFDFIIGDQTDQPYLIEMNPRATQTAHFPLGHGRDLPAALYAALTSQAVRETSSVTTNDVIAIFPLEWQRSPASKFLQAGYHDVPWDDPALVREGMRPRPRRWRWRR